MISSDLTSSRDSSLMLLLPDLLALAARRTWRSRLWFPIEHRGDGEQVAPETVAKASATGWATPPTATGKAMQRILCLPSRCALGDEKVWAELALLALESSGSSWASPSWQARSPQTDQPTPSSQLPPASQLGTQLGGNWGATTNYWSVTLCAVEVLAQYKKQQSSERGFRFLKDLLLFTSSVFLKSRQRIMALAMLMALCLLVYALAQRQLRQALNQAKTGIPHQLSKLTDTNDATVFQCFQSVHLVIVAGHKQISNLTLQRRKILQFLAAPWLYNSIINQLSTLPNP